MTTNVPILVKIYLEMLILECLQGRYERDGMTDGSVTISLRNFVGEGIMNLNMVVQP